MGIGVFTTAIRGLGRSAMAQSLDTVWWSCGSSVSETILAPMDLRTSLSEKKYWRSMNALMKTSIVTIPAPWLARTARKAR